MDGLVSEMSWIPSSFFFFCFLKISDIFSLVVPYYKGKKFVLFLFGFAL
jgi:hypothetical protein